LRIRNRKECRYGRLRLAILISEIPTATASDSLIDGYKTAPACDGAHAPPWPANIRCTVIALTPV
jgi:hypothetical protein